MVEVQDLPLSAFIYATTDANRLVGLTVRAGDALTYKWKVHVRERLYLWVEMVSERIASVPKSMKSVLLSRMWR